MSGTIKLNDELTAEFTSLLDAEVATHAIMQSLFAQVKGLAAERRMLWARVTAELKLSPEKDHEYVVGVGIVEK